MVMDDAALAAAGIELQTLVPSQLSEELRAPGEVVDNAYGTSLITPRVESLVIRRHARIGDEVQAGAQLVTLSSVEVANAQADLRIAEEEWRRVSALGREAVSGRRIKEAKVALDRARATARAYGLSGSADGRSNGEFTLDAPHAGRLTEDDFVVGQRIEPGKTLFRLVDESTVWVDAKLPSESASHVKAGTPAVIISGGRRIAGTVMRNAHRTSEATRNATVRVEVPNPDDRLHSGDYVDVYFETTLAQTWHPKRLPDWPCQPAHWSRSMAKPWCSDATPKTTRCYLFLFERVRSSAITPSSRRVSTRAMSSLSPVSSL
ncbi:MAG: efflux RND transporter periplasmic adaptor subunit [Xanthomonadales bacterium]|nr:efflux RND transporter periplasmic adaptor subunit [Xanthomonadales bacterium]